MRGTGGTLVKRHRAGKRCRAAGARIGRDCAARYGRLTNSGPNGLSGVASCGFVFGFGISGRAARRTTTLLRMVGAGAAALRIGRTCRGRNEVAGGVTVGRAPALGVCADTLATRAPATAGPAAAGAVTAGSTTAVP